MPVSRVRPTTIAELRERQKLMLREEGLRQALAFQPQPTDVIITPYAKSGTTWVQQIVHGLRTRGSIVVRQSSVEFMRAHQRQFDDHLIREARDAVCGLPPGGESTKVRTGNVGDHTWELPPEISADLDRLWREEIETTLGFPSYPALRAALSR